MNIICEVTEWGCCPGCIYNGDDGCELIQAGETPLELDCSGLTVRVVCTRGMTPADQRANRDDDNYHREN